MRVLKEGAEHVKARARTKAWRAAHPGYKPDSIVAKAASNRWKSEHAEEVREYEKRPEVKARRRQKYVQRWLAHQVRYIRWRCKKKGIPFDETAILGLSVPEVCPVLGIAIVIGTGKRHPGSPSIDRNVPSRGYVAGNVAVISARANTIKNDGTAEEHRSIAAWIEAAGVRAGRDAA